VPGLLATVATRIVTEQLSASVGAPGQYDFGVRRIASRLAQKAPDTRRPSHPAPTFVTIAKRPSDRSGTTPPYTFSEKKKVKIFFADRAGQPNQPVLTRKNRVSAASIFRQELASAESLSFRF